MSLLELNKKCPRTHFILHSKYFSSNGCFSSDEASDIRLLYTWYRHRNKIICWSIFRRNLHGGLLFYCIAGGSQAPVDGLSLNEFSNVWVPDFKYFNMSVCFWPFIWLIKEAWPILLKFIVFSQSLQYPIRGLPLTSRSLEYFSSFNLFLLKYVTFPCDDTLLHHITWKNAKIEFLETSSLCNVFK